MRLPGTRYQEHGWEQVRKMLGRCSLSAFAQLDPATLQAKGSLAEYIDLTAEAMHGAARTEASGNSYGESVYELAMTLLYELQARPGDWAAFCTAVQGEQARLGPFWRAPSGEAILRKKVNDMFALLRDKVDSDNYQVACGRPCSPNKIYTYRMLDTAYGEIARLFAGWQEHREQVSAILGRAVDAMPIEVRQMKTIAHCKAEWVINWSASREQFGDGPGPLHTRSKRFASLKNNPQTIGLLMAEIGDYEELSSNRDQDYLFDEGEAAGWMEDLWRVVDEAPLGEAPDRILPAPPDSADTEAEQACAVGVSLPPRFMSLARGAQDRESAIAQVLATESLPVRLAVFLRMLGGADDTYPAEWLDPATGELPTMAQLAGLDGLSLPTLRKRRDAAMAKLEAAALSRKDASNDD